MGSKNKIDPGKSLDKDLYTLSEQEVKRFQHLWIVERGNGVFR